jgi:response regulator RpfG family c-di-GMP phosphodiesterase
MVLESGPTVGGRDSEGSTSTDLYQLWQKAFVSYNNNLRGSKSKNAVSIEALPRIRTLDGVITQVDQASREWDTHRHKGRIDKLRSAVAEYLGLAQTVGDLVVQSAVAVQAHKYIHRRLSTDDYRTRLSHQPLPYGRLRHMLSR